MIAVPAAGAQLPSALDAEVLKARGSLLQAIGQ